MGHTGRAAGSAPARHDAEGIMDYWLIALFALAAILGTLSVFVTSVFEPSPPKPKKPTKRRPF